MKHAHRFAFYLLAGMALAIAGFLMGFYPAITMRWLILAAAVHAVVYGIFSVIFAYRAVHHPLERGAMYLLGSASIVFSGVLASQSRGFENPSATALLGAYLCFVGIKLLLFAWDLRQRTVFVKHGDVRLASATH